MELGRASPEDLPAIESLSRANDWGSTDFDQGTWYAARDDGEIVGVVRVADLEPGVRYVDDALVHERRRGAGIGTDLMRHVLEERDESYYLVCHDPRIAFYERLGFKLIEEPELPESARHHAYATGDLPSREDHVHHLMRR